MLPTVLFEDDDLLIVSKPAGIVVHPAYKNPSGTLLDALAATPDRWSEGRRPSIVGRVDRLASGAVVVAKSAEIHRRLQRTLAAPESEKIYLALAHGVAAERVTIDRPLAADPADRRRRIVCENGSPSVTEIERLADGMLECRPVSLVRCRLRTGRRHQIRVHLAASGWPIVGDAVYGQAHADFPRIALHAARIAFRHPISERWVDVSDPLPVEIMRLLSHSGIAAHF